MKLLRLVPVALVLAASAGAQDGPCIRQTRFWGGDGSATSSVVVNGHAFFGGRNLRVADLADPLMPEVVQELRFDTPVADLGSHQDRVFVVNHVSEMTVIDATDPDRATVTGSFSATGGYWRLRHVSVHGDVGVTGGSIGGAVPNRSSKLYFLDLADPGPVPTELGSITIDGPLDALALGGNVAVAYTDEYVDYGAGISFPPRLWFIDAVDPTTPVVVAAVDITDLLITGLIRDLAARDNHLAITDTDGRLLMVDITDPTDPELVSLIRALGIGIATIEFEGAFIHAAGASCAVSGGCGGYALINTVQPSNPTVIGSFEGTDLTRPAPYNGYVAAAAGEAGLRVVSLSDPSSPKLLDTTLPMRWAGVIASAGPLMHVIDTTDLSPQGQLEHHTLRVLRRAGDGRLSEVGSLGFPGTVWALAADDNTVAAAIYDEENSLASLDVIDVSDPGQPRLGTRIGAAISFELTTDAPHLAVRGSRLVFSLEGSDSILIYEVAEGGGATQVGQYLPGAKLASFAAPSEDLMVVAVHQGEMGWIEVVDISDPGASSVVGVFEIPDQTHYPVSLDAEATRVVVQVRDSEPPPYGPWDHSILLDISDPSAPVQTADLSSGNAWVALGNGIFHTIIFPYNTPPFHMAYDVSVPTDIIPGESLGILDLPRFLVDADGPYFCLSRGWVEVHNYGPCRALPAYQTWPAFEE